MTLTNEQPQTDADYATAIRLLGEVGLLLTIVGLHKHKLFRGWNRERDKLLRTPRAQAALWADSEAFIREAST
jgi:hypothetical protein